MAEHTGNQNRDNGERSRRGNRTQGGNGHQSAGKRSGDKSHHNRRRNEGEWENNRRHNSGDRDHRRRNNDDREHGRGHGRGHGERNDRREGGHHKRDHNGNDQHRGDGRQRSQRGGAGRNKQFSGPVRSGYREERIKARENEPDLPSDIDIQDLDPLVLQDLKVLSRDNADAVAKHMFMAATLMADDPQLALRHARAAKERAGRVAVTRETNGIAAYHAGEWKEALSELRAARRISGGPGLLAVMADCERGLGRPEKAIAMARSEEAELLDPESKVEFAIVIAGARADLEHYDSALLTLQRANPSEKATGATAARLSYAYADALARVGRKDEAAHWFQVADAQDEYGDLDALERVKELEN